MWIRRVIRTPSVLSIAKTRLVSTNSLALFSVRHQPLSFPIGRVAQNRRPFTEGSILSRNYATHTPDNDGASGVLDTNWSEHEFVHVAETSLELILEAVSKYGFDPSVGLEDFDIDFSQGVLTINLGSHGTYVLNTQTPNRQIWLSSPVSGPWRYAWHPARREWISSRDGHSLARRLGEEFSEAFNQCVSFDFANAVK